MDAGPFGQQSFSSSGRTLAVLAGETVESPVYYTNIVSVSAVHDRYGVAVNEGANKQGHAGSCIRLCPDAYAFTKSKLLASPNGGNLFALPEKHGIEAGIDLKRAELLQSEKE